MAAVVRLRSAPRLRYDRLTASEGRMQLFEESSIYLLHSLLDCRITLNCYLQ